VKSAIAKAVNPFMKRSYGRLPHFSSLLRVLCIVLSLTLGVVVGVFKASDQAERYTRSTGVIVEVGDEPSREDYPQYTISKVNLNPGGEPDIREAETVWYVDKGDEIDYWTQGDEVSFDGQSSFWRFITLEYALWGALVALVLYCIMDLLEKLVIDEDRRKAQELDDQRENPDGLDEFIAVCEAHTTTVITWKMARRYGACEQGLKGFQSEYFPERTEVTLGELLPLIRGSNPYWWDIIRVVTGVLVESGVVRSSYRSENRLQRPEEVAEFPFVMPAADTSS
jgi:hypothetical protein